MSNAFQKQQQVQRLPFSTADETTDIVFVVEEKRIHFAKAILSMCSPVFRAMFASDFAEKEAKEIPLPGKKYVHIVELFKHLHPAYGPMTQVTDGSLFTLLELADEYQINSVKEKCQQFIGHQVDLANANTTNIDIRDTQSLSERLSVDRNLLYLLACDKFKLSKHQERLVELAARRDVSDLTTRPLSKSFETNSLILALCKRCQMLEEALKMCGKCYHGGCL